MEKWNIDRYEISLSKEIMNIGNVSIMEHPHGGLVAVICYINSIMEENTHHIASFYFNEQDNSWNPQGDILSFTSSIGSFSQTTYLNLMGNLQLMYCADQEIRQYFSFDYGKTWKESDRILEDSITWFLRNHPLFMRMGRVVLPVYDEGSGRSFAYISDDTGKNWFPSVFIEPTEDMMEISAAEDFFAWKMQSPTFIHAGERKIICFMQPKNRDYLLRAVSNDFGETWSSAVESEIPSGTGSINAIRLRDSNGDYTPVVVLAYGSEKDNEKYSVNLVISRDVGETWGKHLELAEVESAYTDISLIQTDDNKLHVLFSSEQEVNHVIVNDFIRI